MLATFAAITDQKLAKGQGIDSFNALPLFTKTNAKSARTEMVIMPHKKAYTSIRIDEWVYIPGPGSGGMTRISKDQLKTMKQQQLYNLKEDPYQKNNLINEYPEKAEVLQKALQEKLDSVPANLPKVGVFN